MLSAIRYDRRLSNIDSTCDGRRPTDDNGKFVRLCVQHNPRVARVHLRQLILVYSGHHGWHGGL